MQYSLQNNYKIECTNCQHNMGGGRMNKAQADIEAKKIFDEAAKKSEKIIEEAKKNGTWQMGLDSNKGLFKDLEKETKEKLKMLASMIDEE